MKKWQRENRVAGCECSWFPIQRSFAKETESGEVFAVKLNCERTEDEYRELLSAAHLELEEVVPTAGPLSLVIAQRKK
jgi:hypothetical protein